MASSCSDAALSGVNTVTPDIRLAELKLSTLKKEYTFLQNKLTSCLNIDKSCPKCKACTKVSCSPCTPCGSVPTSERGKCPSCQATGISSMTLSVFTGLLISLSSTLPIFMLK